MTQLKHMTAEDRGQSPRKVISYSGDVTRSRGYRLVSVDEDGCGLKAELKLIGPAANAFGLDVSDLTVEVQYVTADQLRVHIFDTQRTQYQISQSLLPGPISSAHNVHERRLKFDYQHRPFAFWVSRRSGEILFDTRPQHIPVHLTPLQKDETVVRDSSLPAYPLVFSDQYLQLATALPADTNIYGLGDVVSTSGFRRDNHGTVQSFWNGDPAGNPPDRNLYGTHAFHLEHRYDRRSQTSSSHGVFLKNSHGMDVILRTGVLEYRCLGGTLDMTFMAGPSPKAVVQQYAGVVGKPAQMPFWAFGFHLCRIEYTTIEETQEAVRRMHEADVPLECIWNDYFYMDRKRNFTLSKDFPVNKFRSFIADLHERHQHYVPLVDAGMFKPGPSDDTYLPYEEGHALGVFLKKEDGEEYEGQVWGGLSVWPDWTHPQTSGWWHACLEKFRESIEFDGIWLDMNEPANLPRSTDRWLSTKAVVEVDGRVFVDMGQNKWDYPPYPIHNGWKALEDLTIAPSIMTADGYRHYNSHNLYPIQEALCTSDSLEKLVPGKRPFILSRGTFAGQGRLTAHWLGDNESKWNCIRENIQGVLQHQLFQMPMCGADVGGFGGPTTEELLNRWMQLGAFLPFYRNHNASVPQEPYLYDSVIKASQIAIAIRYRLIPTWESLFVEAHLEGTPPVRPLFFEFDHPALFGVDLQFMVGSSLLVSPCLFEGDTTVTGYFPSSKGTFWRDWYTHQRLDVNADDSATLDSPLGYIPVHIRSGSIILMHTEARYTLTETKQCPLELLVALDVDHKAEAVYHLDDGLSSDPQRVVLACHVSDSRISISSKGAYTIPQHLEKITVLGVAQRPRTVELEGRTLNFAYDAETEALRITNLDHALNAAFRLTWK